jgi:peptidyl-prolyl cis-trans isomerase D
MISFFRRIFDSKFGVAIVLAIVGIIGLSFALADVSGSSTFGGVAGGDRVASVGSRRIGTGDLSRRITSTVESMRERSPELTVKGFLADNGLEYVLTGLIKGITVRVWGEQNHFAPSDRLVDREIDKNPAFKGADGKFNPEIFRAMVGQRGLTEAQAREEIAQGISAQLLLTSADMAPAMPRDAVLRYASVQIERRVGAIGLLPSASFAPATLPGDKEVADWYASHSRDYMRPERRVIRYASYTEAAIGAIPAPTDAEIQARYTANAAEYAASEKRRITQLVLPTEAAAKAVMAEITGGKSLEASASGKGLAAASLGLLSQDQLSGQSSPAVATATFAAKSGVVAGPVKSGLGWHLMRVDAVEGKPARSLADVRSEIVKVLSEEKRRKALVDFAVEIKDEFDNGSALGDVAKKLGLTLSVTEPLLANGNVFGKEGVSAPGELQPVLANAFSMEGEGQPDVAEVVPDKTFMIYDVGSLTDAAPAPLAEVRAQVVQDIQLSKGAVAAKAAAKKIEALLKKGTEMAAAMATLGATLPPVDNLDMTREELAKRYGQKPPLPLRVLFSMAKGSIKLIGAPRNRGWYLLDLNEVIPGKIDPTDARLASLVKQLNEWTAAEYGEQLVGAMAAEIGVERNDAGIRAVRTGLLGSN